MATPETGIGERGPWELQSVHLYLLLLQIMDPSDCIRNNGHSQYFLLFVQCFKKKNLAGFQSICF